MKKYIPLIILCISLNSCSGGDGGSGSSGGSGSIDSSEQSIIYQSNDGTSSIGSNSNPTSSPSYTSTTYSDDSCSSKSGACSWHDGVNCEAGPDIDGSVICNDGWTGSSVAYVY